MIPRERDNGGMSQLPLPVRVCAGLIATAVEQVRALPRLLVELPVTAVSQALQVSMRAQQRVTELAIKGDKVLSVLSPVPERPAWAVFDDELEEDLEKEGVPASAAVGGRVAVSTNGSPVTPLRPATSLERELDEVLGAEATEHEEPVAEPAEEEPAGPPAVLPGYPAMSLPQLRGKLRTLSLADLRTLLAWETAHENRPPYVTMLSNRITTVSEA